MDTIRLRKYFPALAGERGIYLDNAATSLTPKSVISEVARFYDDYNVNVGRGVYEVAARLTLEVEEAREHIASFIGAAPGEIAFSTSTTDSINKLALSFPFKPRDVIAVSLLEHHSNLLPWRLAAQKQGLELKVVPIDEDGIIDLNEAEIILSKGARLFTFTAASNVLGTVQPVRELTDLAHSKGVLVAIDAAQYVGHRPFNVKETGCDFMAFSAHKMCGPMGVGVLYVSSETQKLLEPAILGGGTVQDVTKDGLVLKDFPQSFEPGTSNIPGILGFAEAVRFIQKIGLEEIENKVSDLYKKLYHGLTSKESVVLYVSQAADNVGIVSFNIQGLSSHQTASLYDRRKRIMLRSGFHCALPLVQALGAGSGTIRVSPAFYNSEEEIDIFLETTDAIIGAI